MRQATFEDLVLDYFKVPILESEQLDPDIRVEIEKTFQYCFKKKQNIRSIIHELEGTELEAMRNRIIKRLGSTMNPYPIKLGPLKPFYQEKAHLHNRSAHGEILHDLWAIKQGRVIVVDFPFPYRIVRRRFKRVDVQVEQLKMFN